MEEQKNVIDKEELREYFSNSPMLPEPKEHLLSNSTIVYGKIDFYLKNKYTIKFILLNKQNYQFIGKIDKIEDLYFVLKTKDNQNIDFSYQEVDSDTIIPEEVNPILNFIRPVIPESTRTKIFTRDGHRCKYNFEGCTYDKCLEIDHIVPICIGGSSEESNLITSCSNCNKLKGKRLVF